MVQSSDIRAHMEVVGSDGLHVGIVDRVEGERIKLAGAVASGAEHAIPLSSVIRVDSRVHILGTAGATLEALRAGKIETTADGPIRPSHHIEQQKWIPWIVGLFALLLAFGVVKSCSETGDAPPNVRSGQAPDSEVNPTGNTGGRE